MTSHAIDTFATTGPFADAARPEVKTAGKPRRSLAELAMLGLVLTAAVLHLASVTLHPSAATSLGTEVAIVGP